MSGVVIRGAKVVDGTGAAAFLGDVGVRDGKIDFIARSDDGIAASGSDGADREVVDGTGLILTPGFVDPHTHYDAQLGWDPTASPSEFARRDDGDRWELWILNCAAWGR